MSPSTHSIALRAKTIDSSPTSAASAEAALPERARAAMPSKITARRNNAKTVWKGRSGARAGVLRLREIALEIALPVRDSESGKVQAAQSRQIHAVRVIWPSAL